MTITGTGFVAGSTVSFVEESGGSPASDNTVLVAPTTYVSPTTLTATAPAVVEGVTYYVTVTTLKGTSAQTSSAIFTYTSVAPVITGISPSVGSIAGGNSITISGSAFVNNVLVKFVQESGGTPVSGGVTVSCHVGLPPCQVNVLSSTTMTVVSPGIVTGTTYFITVTTPYGLSPTSANDVFTFSPLVPTVSSVSPNAGPDAGGTSIVITGTGFVNGASVSFIKQSTGCGGFGAISANNVTVVGSQTITATSPAVSAAAPYYVYVTTPSGPSSCYPVFTYTG